MYLKLFGQFRIALDFLRCHVAHDFDGIARLVRIVIAVLALLQLHCNSCETAAWRAQIPTWLLNSLFSPPPPRVIAGRGEPISARVHARALVRMACVRASKVSNAPSAMSSSSSDSPLSLMSFSEDEGALYMSSASSPKSSPNALIRNDDELSRATLCDEKCGTSGILRGKMRVRHNYSQRAGGQAWSPCCHCPCFFPHSSPNWPPLRPTWTLRKATRPSWKTNRKSARCWKSPWWRCSASTTSRAATPTCLKNLHWDGAICLRLAWWLPVRFALSVAFCSAHG